MPSSVKRITIGYVISRPYVIHTQRPIFLYGGRFLKALAVENLTFYYGPRLILDEVTFSVSSGSICGLLGPNGSGKTTLIKCINGILKPAKGRISVNNVSLKQMDRQEIAKNMSVVPQQTNTIFAFKVVDMVVMGRSPTLEMWQNQLFQTVMMR